MSYNTKILFGFFFLAAVLPFTGCLKDSCERQVTYLRYTPIWLNPADWRTDIQSQAPRPMQKPGKFFVAGDYVLINELHEGIHVVDNSNPGAPQNVAFIPIPGNVDIFVKDDIIYADNWIDLVAIRFLSPTSVELLDRELSVFPNFGTDPAGAVLVGYEEEVVTETMDCQSNMVIDFGWDIAGGGVFTSPMPVGVASESTGGSFGGVNAPGSMSRFSISGDVLYALHNWELRVVDLSTPANPVLGASVPLNMQGETLFAYDGHLFMGGNVGMNIYSLQNPLLPTWRSTYSHMTACDPVAIQGNRAYVTLRSGTPCNSTANQLDVVDISNLDNPTEIAVYPMANPHGLAVHNNILWLCEGSSGLKTFNVANDLTIPENLLHHIRDLHAFDVIKLPGKSVVLVIGDNGLYQYDIANPSSPQRLSMLPLGN